MTELFQHFNYGWLLLGTVVTILLALDLGVLNRKDEVISLSKSLYNTAFYFCIAILFPISFFWVYPEGQVIQSINLYWTGFILEKSLSLDNIFVISLIMSYFAINPKHQHKILFWGIIGVIVLRGIFIGAGSFIVEQFHGILYIFSAFLLYTGLKLLLLDGDNEEDNDLSDSSIVKFVKKHLPYKDSLDCGDFFVKVVEDGKIKTYFSTLFLALVIVELMDLVFALDSIPAVFSITTDPFIVFSSNLFAILGLRSLFFALQAMLSKFEKLEKYIALVLVFIGSKLFIMWGFDIEHFPTSISLGVTVAILGTGVAHSLISARD